MKNSKRFLGATAAVLIAIGLGACSNKTDDQSGSQSSDAQSGTASEQTPEVDRDPKQPLPAISGDKGKAPTITPIDDTPPSVITVKTLDEGNGLEVKPDDLITVNYAGFLWDGTPFDSSFDRDDNATFGLNGVIEGWKYGLSETKVGDRLELVIPPEYGYGPTGTGSIPGDSTLVFVVEILGVVDTDVAALKEATLKDVELPAGLTINGKLGEEPEIYSAADAVAPKEPQTILLAEGAGPVVTDADQVVYHYAGAYWGGSEIVDSSWATGPDVRAANGLAFLGEKVGSRIAVINPAQSAEQPATVLVVDVLGVVPSYNGD